MAYVGFDIAGNYCNLLCYLKGITLNSKQIKLYQSRLSQPEILELPLPLQCLFLDETKPSSIQRIKSLEDRFGLFNNLDLLSGFVVSTQVMHSQKISVLSDIYKCIIQTLALTDDEFQKFHSNENTKLVPLLPNQDILANLFLYSFNFRDELAKTTL